MATVRGLLQQGNQKLGTAIHTWSLPAGSEGCCPGASDVCRSVCYALKSRYLFTAVQERLAWNLEQCLRDDFVDRMVHEIRCKGVLVLRVHVAGDFFDEQYSRKWLGIMRKAPKVRYYWYTRSWRIEAIERVLREMAQLRQVRGWYSVDAETGVPASVPPGIRIAYLQTEPGEQPELADLVFRTRRVRKERQPLTVVCPHETPQGREETNCGNCRRCWQ